MSFLFNRIIHYSEGGKKFTVNIIHDFRDEKFNRDRDGKPQKRGTSKRLFGYDRKTGILWNPRFNDL